MNLSYFKEFLILAKTKNYWEASERLFLNQSTLSKHIKAMEKELGVPLFDRTTRKVTLTEFGQTLLPYAQSIVSLQSEYTTALTQKQNENQKLVTIGSISSLKRYHVTDLITDYQMQYPDYNVHIMENDTQHLKQMLLSHKCELAFLREASSTRSVSADGITRIPYACDHMVAVVSDQHPLSGRKSISIKDLAGEKLCLPKKNTILYNLCCSACEEAGFTPNVVYDSHYIGSIIDMIVCNGGIGLITNLQIEPILSPARSSRPPVVQIPMESAISTQISLCYLENGTLSEGAEAFVEFFKRTKTILKY